MIKSKSKSIFVVLFCFLFMLILALTTSFIVQARSINYLDVQFVNKKVSAFLGERVELPIVKLLYPQYVNDFAYSVYDSNDKQIPLTDDSFIPSSEGDYKINLTVLGNDGGNFIHSYTLSASRSPSPVLVQAPYIPVAFMDQTEYFTPKAQFVDYNSSSPVNVDYSVSVVDDEGISSIVGDSFTPSVRLHSNKIQLVYKATSPVTHQSIEKIYSIPVVKANSTNADGEFCYDYDKMFLSTGVDSSTINSSGTVFSASNDFSLSFVNKLDKDFSMNISALPSNANFEKIIVTLSDSLNNDKSITLAYSHIDDKQSLFSLNNIGENILDGSITSPNGLNISVDKKSNVYDGNQKIIGVVKNFANGGYFSGFSSGFIHLTIDVIGVTGPSSISIQTINKQYFDIDNVVDSISPYYYLDRVIPTMANLHDSIIIPKIIGYDVLSPIVTSFVSVTNIDGDPIPSTDGINLYEADANRDYEININAFGEYNVQYILYDISDNIYDSIYFTIVVRDNTPPSLSLNSSLPSTVKSGDNITIPTLSYDDGEEGTIKDNLKVFITISLSRGNYVVVSQNQKFTFDQKGSYFLRFSVIDDYLNVTTIEHKVVCI